MAIPQLIEPNSKAPINIQDLITQIQNYYSSANLDIIRKAYQIAEKAHKNQYRKDGSLYISHPLCVASILADLKLDLYTIIAGLLHDVVEDTPLTLKDIEKEFNQTIAFLVDGVSKISRIHFKKIQQKDSENMRKMVVAMARDIRVILIKLADRLHNMRTLHHLPEEKRLKIAQETLDIYSPLASRLGIYSIKMELEDLAFQYSDFKSFQSLSVKMDSEKTETEKYIKKVILILDKEITDQMQLKASVTGRPKNLYSIYQKMITRNLDYHQVHDVLAFRICVDTVEDCYKVLGLIHSLWKPIPGHFKDFIAIPKINHYQSLHTTVLGEQNKRIEIQIRTFDMHVLAEKGIAAHWKYKTESWKDGSAVDQKTLKKFNWLQDLVSLHQQSHHSGEFMESVKMDLFDCDIYIFTPQGDVKEFPKGATPIDFAYCVHTDLGHHITGAKVNNRMVPLKYKLKNGDTVEVLISKNQNPSDEWLKYCVTSKAKSKIKAYVKMESRKKAIEIGEKLLEKEIRHKGLKKEDVYQHSAWTQYLKRKKINKKEDLYAYIGYGKILAKDLITPLLIEQKFSEKELAQADQVKNQQVRKAKSTDDAYPVTVEDIGNVMVSFAKCCRPIPGDTVTGFIRRGQGIVVHRQSCRYLLTMDSERYVDVQWNQNSGGHKHTAVIKVITHDTPGALNALTKVFVEQNVNIFNLKAHIIRDMKSVCFFSVLVKDLKQLQNLIYSLKSIKHVINVTRSC